MFMHWVFSFGVSGELGVRDSGLGGGGGRTAPMIMQGQRRPWRIVSDVPDDIIISVSWVGYLWRVRTCVDEGRDNLHSVCGGRVGIDLADRVYRIGGVFEISAKIALVVVQGTWVSDALLKDGLTACCSIVKSSRLSLAYNRNGVSCCYRTCIRL